MMAAGQQSHALEDFKRFHKSKNYRRIFDNQHEFAVLVKDDPELQKQFVEDLGKMAVIERALGAARQREAMQDVSAPGRSFSSCVPKTRSCSSMTRS